MRQSFQREDRLNNLVFAVGAVEGVEKFRDPLTGQALNPSTKLPQHVRSCHREVVEVLDLHSLPHHNPQGLWKTGAKKYMRRKRTVVCCLTPLRR